MCYPHDTNEKPFKCTMKKDICANKEKFAKWDSMNKDGILSNWMQQMNLECADSYQIGMFGTAIYASEVISNVILPPIADKYGRRLFVYYGSVIQLVSYILVIFSSSYSLALTTVFIYGITMSIRMFITYPHLMEVLPPSVAPKVSNSLFFMDGFLYILSPLLLLIFGNTNSLLIFGTILNVISLIGLVKVR